MGWIAAARRVLDAYLAGVAHARAFPDCDDEEALRHFLAAFPDLASDLAPGLFCLADG